MKRLVAGLLAVLLLAGCGYRHVLREEEVPLEEGTEEALPPAVAEEAPATRLVGPIEDHTGLYLGSTGLGMYLEGRLPYYPKDRVVSAQVEYYVDVEIDPDGNYYWDDAWLTTAVVRMEDRYNTVYPLVEREYSNAKWQFYSVYDHDSGESRLLGQRSSPTSLHIFAYTYLDGEDAFLEEEVYAVTGNIEMTGPKGLLG